MYNARVDGDGEVTVDDSVTLTYLQRCKTRLRVTLDNTGDDAGIQLPRGTVLRDGDLLRAADAHVIRIIAAKESVSTLRVGDGDNMALARAAYHLGNRHLAVQIGRGWLRYLADHVIDDMLRAHGFCITHEEAPFDAEGGAYSIGGGHGDGHGDGRGHGDGHRDHGHHHD